MFGIKRLLGIASLEERVEKMGEDMPEVARCAWCGKMDFVENLVPLVNEDGGCLVPGDWIEKLRDMLGWIHPACFAASPKNYGRRATDRKPNPEKG